MKKEKVGLARKEFNQVMKRLVKKGYDATKHDIIEFWQKYSFEINNETYGYGAYGPFEYQILWKKKESLNIQNSIREYLNEKNLNSVRPSFSSTNKTIIDFEDWQYNSNGINYSKSSLATVRVRDDSGTTHDLLDFTGIDLSGIRVEKCVIEKCYFNSAFFDNSTFEYVEFRSCMLDGASFYQSNLSNVTFTENTTIRGIYIDGATIEYLQFLDNDSLPFPFIYTKVRFWWMLKILYKERFEDGMTIHDLRKQQHTTFLHLDTTRLTSPRLKRHAEYINWFLSLIDNLHGYNRRNWKSRTGFFLAVITTKYWSSFTQLGLFAFAVNILYALAYFAESGSFKGLGNIAGLEGFINCLYFSVITFTTLGYGDITPTTMGAQIGVISEVAFGYTVLGLLIYLISRKVDKLF